jgi:hypothetical protein
MINIFRQNSEILVPLQILIDHVCHLLNSPLGKREKFFKKNKMAPSQEEATAALLRALGRKDEDIKFLRKECTATENKYLKVVETSVAFEKKAQKEIADLRQQLKEALIKRESDEQEAAEMRRNATVAKTAVAAAEKAAAEEAAVEAAGEAAAEAAQAAAKATQAAGKAEVAKATLHAAKKVAPAEKAAAKPPVIRPCKLTFQAAPFQADPSHKL